MNYVSATILITVLLKSWFQRNKDFLNFTDTEYVIHETSLKKIMAVRHLKEIFISENLYMYI